MWGELLMEHIAGEGGFSLSGVAEVGGGAGGYSAGPRACPGSTGQCDPWWCGHGREGPGMAAGCGTVSQAGGCTQQLELHNICGGLVSAKVIQQTRVGR